MKHNYRILRVLLLAVAALALLPTGALASGNSSSWNMFTFDDYRKYTGSAAPGIGADIAAFSFPGFSPGNPSLPAFLTTTSLTPVLGDLTGKTVSATIGVSVTGAPIFTYGGQGLTWNSCPTPARMRFFFSTRPNTYSLSQANNNPTNYWWSNPVSVEINDQTGTGSIAVSLDPGNWSDGDGHFASDPLALPGFTAAVRSVAQIGLAFGGGCFFDVGVALVPNTGTATFHLVDYQAQ